MTNTKSVPSHGNIKTEKKNPETQPCCKKKSPQQNIVSKKKENDRNVKNKRK